MKRRQLFELEDLEWFPANIRNYMTDFLRTVAEKFDLFGPAVPRLAEMLQTHNSHQIIDLASGGGGQWGTLLPKLQEQHPHASLTLTDRFPNSAALSNLQRQHHEHVHVHEPPVDARDVPDGLKGIRTMLLSLHHFSPEDATAILSNAVDAQTPIVCLEAQQRDWSHLIRFALSPIMVLLITPWIRPLCLGRFCFTYLVPIVPLAVGWDGAVSVMRTYDRSECLAMAHQADPNDAFVWDFEVLSKGPQKIQMLIGEPRNGV